MKPSVMPLIAHAAARCALTWPGVPDALKNATVRLNRLHRGEVADLADGKHPGQAKPSRFVGIRPSAQVASPCWRAVDRMP
jgi:hypothetical protein